MTKINKISVFDQCVNGSFENFRILINPMYNQFDKFYKNYKKTFDNREDSVKSITFKTENENVAIFDVETVDIIEQLPQEEKAINITVEEDTCRFTVQPYKDENPYYLDIN